MNQHLFTCAICDRDVSTYGFNRGPDKQVDPVCRYCEREYGDRPPHAGTFMDRRKATQISALAEALRGRAGAIQWERDHGRA